MANTSQLSRSLLNAPLRLVRLPSTILEEMRNLNESGAAGEARRALVEDVRGFAKATAGFLFGDERLLMSGQIERAKAAERLRALAEDAAAEGIEEDARHEASRTVQQAQRERTQATAAHVARTTEIEAEAAKQRERAEVDALKGRNAVRRRAVGQQIVLNAEEARAREEAAVVIEAAAIEEAVAEEARDRAEELEEARRSGNR
jgi:hypothetical protein